MWDACRVPFVPELFSAPALARLEDKWQVDGFVAVPYFGGLIAVELDALVGSFAAEPELHDPVRGRVKRTRAVETFVTEMNAWIARHAEVLARLGRGEDVDPSEYTFRASTQITTAAPGLDWLNKGVFIAVAGRQAAGVIYETYLVG